MPLKDARADADVTSVYTYILHHPQARVPDSSWQAIMKGLAGWADANMCRPFIGEGLEFDGSSVSIAAPSWPCTGWLHVANLQLPCVKLEKMWNGGHAKRAQNSAKRAQKSANERKIKNCSIWCLTSSFVWQVCFVSYHVDGTRSPSLHRMTFWWFSCMNCVHEPIMNSMHGSWWNPWRCIALLGQKHLLIMHPHEKRWKQPYTLELLGHTCMLLMYVAYNLVHLHTIWQCLC